MARPDNLGLAFLSSPPAVNAGEALVAEVLIAEDTQEVDLGKVPSLAAYRLVGAAPTEGKTEGVVAFEAGVTGSCAGRILIAAEDLANAKAMAIRVEIDVDGAALIGPTEDGAAFCTWLPMNVANTAALECVGMAVTGASTFKRARAWLRLAWSAPQAAALPGWATTALGPPVTSPPGAALGLRAIESPAFDLGATPPLPGDEPSLVAASIAWRPGGWVAAGGYEPYSAGDEMSNGDAVVWFSGDGVAWQRVDTAEVFGGDGYQFAGGVVADASGWWIAGASYTGSEANAQVAQRLWYSSDGRAWHVVVTRPDVSILGIARSSPKGAGAPHGILAAGRVAGTLSSMWLTSDGTVSSTVALPIAARAPAPDPNMVQITSIAGSDDRGWVIAGTYWAADANGSFESHVLAWSSVDGLSWSALDGPAFDAISALKLAGIVDSPFGWLASGDTGIARSADLLSWTPVLPLSVGRVNSIVVTDTTLVALGYTDVNTGWSSTDGVSWSPIGVPAKSRLIGAASDGVQLIGVGGSGRNAGFWVLAGT